MLYKIYFARISPSGIISLPLHKTSPLEMFYNKIYKNKFILPKKKQNFISVYKNYFIKFDTQI
jgi:hypothetical protein